MLMRDSCDVAGSDCEWGSIARMTFNEGESLVSATTHLQRADRRSRVRRTLREIGFNW